MKLITRKVKIIAETMRATGIVESFSHIPSNRLRVDCLEGKITRLHLLGLCEVLSE